MMTPSLGEVSSQAQEGGLSGQYKSVCVCVGGVGQDCEGKGKGRQVLGWVSQQWVGCVVSGQEG